MMLSCMYTKHKTQKNKKYNDGSLVLKKNSLFLRDDQDKVIDCKAVSPKYQFNTEDLIEFPQFLVQIVEQEVADELNRRHTDKGSRETNSLALSQVSDPGKTKKSGIP